MAGLRRALFYIAGTAIAVTVAFIGALRFADRGEPSGMDGSAGFAAGAVAFLVFWGCVLAVIAVESLGAARRIRERHHPDADEGSS
jgi:hypothetical protein